LQCLDRADLQATRDLNTFYKKVHKKMLELIQKQQPSSVEELQCLRNLAKIRTYPALLAILLSGDGSYDDFKKKLATYRRAALAATLTRVGERVPEGLVGDAEKPYVEAAQRLQEGLDKCDEKVKLQVFDVGSKQETISRSGGFKELRGASAMIDAVVNLASETIRRELGEEFIIASEAGELVFLSPPSFAADIERELLKSLKNRLGDYLSVLHLRGNGSSPYAPRVREILSSMGACYVLALSSAKSLSTGVNSEDVPPSDLCRVCRMERALSDAELQDLAGKLLGERSEANWILGDAGRIGVSCAVFRAVSRALTDAINGGNVGKTGLAHELARLSSAYRLMSEIRKATHEPVKFVTGLEEYRCGDREALIAMLTMDGDSFGEIKTSTSTLDEFLLVSAFFTALMERGVLEGARRTLRLAEQAGMSESKVPITPLYFAGDDLLLVVKAESIPHFLEGFFAAARPIAERFQQVLQRKSPVVGVSCGYVVGDTRTPGAFLYEGSRRVLSFVKDVAKKSDFKDFDVHAYGVHSKGRASWDMISRVVAEADGEGGDGENLLREILLTCSGESSLIKAYCLALKESREVLEPLSVNRVKEVLEAFLSEGVAGAAFARWVYDAARKLREETRGAEVREVEILKVFPYKPDPPSYAWKWLYHLAVLLEAAEDYAECVATRGGKVDEAGRRQVLEELADMLGWCRDVEV